MSDSSGPRNFKNLPEGGAIRALYAVAQQGAEMRRLAEREDSPPNAAQLIEAQSEVFQDDMRQVQSEISRVLMLLGLIEINLWNLSVREEVAELGRTLMRDLNRAYSHAYPATLFGVLDAPDALDQVASTSTVKGVLDTFHERFMAIYEGWREANPCLRRHRAEDVRPEELQ
jgi:hypothetical protein